MKQFLRTATLIACIICLATMVMAQTLRFGAALFPQRPLEDSSGNLALQRATLGISLPLYNKIERKEGKLLPSIRSLQLGVNTAYNHVSCTLLPRDLNNINLAAGLRYFSFNGSRNTWILNATPFVSAASNQLGNSRIGLLSFGIYQHRVNETWSYRLGAFYIEYNRSIVLPFAGLDYHLDKQQWVQFNLPFNCAYHLRKGRGSEWKAAFGYNGLMSQVQAGPPPAYMRLRQLLLELGYTKRVNRHLSWNLTGGFAGGRQLKLYHTKQDVYAVPVKTGLFVQGALVYRVLREKKAPATPADDPFNLDNFNTEDLNDLEKELEQDNQ